MSRIGYFPSDNPKKLTAGAMIEPFLDQVGKSLTISPKLIKWNKKNLIKSKPFDFSIA